MSLAVVIDKNPKGFKGQTPLHDAARNGRIEIVKIILENIEDKNPKDTEKWTPFHFAAIKGHAEIVQIFLNLVEDKHPKTIYYGDTPLHFAAKMGYIRICEMILAKVEEKNPKNNRNETPFSLAKIYGHFDVCNKISEFMD